MKTVEQLRQEGYKVRVMHFRRQEVAGSRSKTLKAQESVLELVPQSICWNPLPRGGKTVVEVTTPKGDTWRGESSCTPSDTFDRKLGLTKALGRALGAPVRELRAKRREHIATLSLTRESH